MTAICTVAHGSIAVADHALRYAPEKWPEQILHAVNEYLRCVGSDDKFAVAADVRLDEGAVVFTLRRTEEGRRSLVGLEGLRDALLAKLQLGDASRDCQNPESVASNECTPEHEERPELSSQSDWNTDPKPEPRDEPTIDLPIRTKAIDQELLSCLSDLSAVTQRTQAAETPKVDTSGATTIPRAGEDVRPRSLQSIHGQAESALCDDPARTESEVSAEGKANIVRTEASNADRESSQAPNPRPLTLASVDIPAPKQIAGIVEACEDVVLVTVQNGAAWEVVVGCEVASAIAADLIPGGNLSGRLAGLKLHRGGIAILHNYHLEGSDDPPQ